MVNVRSQTTLYIDYNIVSTRRDATSYNTYVNIDILYSKTNHKVMYNTYII